MSGRTWCEWCGCEWDNGNADRHPRCPNACGEYGTTARDFAHTLEDVARAFWRGVCASRAAYVDNNAEAWRWDEHKARNVGNADDADDFWRMAEKHERQAAWLRACAEAT